MTDHPLGSHDRPLRVAVIGSGPSAFYATDALFKADGLTALVDMFDRLPTPFGLVRGGVAPDHQNIKGVVKGYERTASHVGFRFFGNVMLGRDIQVSDLAECYDHVVYAVGNESDRPLGIPGQDLRGVYSATEFVGWYNGHPDFRDRSFDLDKAKRVAVIGNGNVAMDVTRVLVKHPDTLSETDIADYALEALRSSGVRDVILLGRRGPAQAAFSPKEIQEVAEVEGCDLVVPEAEAAVDDVSARWLETLPPADRTAANKNIDVLKSRVPLGEGENERKVRVQFCVAPVELIGDGGKVRAVKVEHAELKPDDRGTPRPCGTGRFSEVEADLVFAAIGYRGVQIEGVPFDEGWGVIPNEEGRVVVDRSSKRVVPGQYVVGWAKRGPTGLVGTNNADSKKTVVKMLEDLQGKTAPALSENHRDLIVDLLRDRGVDFVTFDDWKRLDAYELAEGEKRGKVRDKLTSVDDMMRVVKSLRE